MTSCFGIADTALQKFRYYLAGSSQSVLLNRSFSEDFSLPHGVPQGSWLGPLLFTIYASKLFEVVMRHLPDVYADDNQHTKTAYADDNQLYTAISRKVVGKNVHATIPKGNMGYDQYTVPDTVAVKPTFVAFL